MAVRWSPVRSEPLARGIGEFLGGPVGRYGLVGTQRRWTPLAVLSAVALAFLAFAYLYRVPCLSGTNNDGVWSVNWSGSRQYTATCYNDIVALYGVEGLEDGHFPYAYSWQEESGTRYMEYPVATGLFMYIVATITRAILSVVPLPMPAASLYFSIIALVMAFFWVWTVRLVAHLAGNRLWDAVLVAASPLVIVHAFTNFDILPIFCVVLALVRLRERRYIAVGVLIGLGTALKLWPLFLLGALLTVAVRDARAGSGRVAAPWAQFVKPLLAAVVTWLVINLPIMVAYPAGWREFFRLNTERGAEWTTIYQAINRIFGVNIPIPVLNTLSFILFAAACAAIFLYGSGLVSRSAPTASANTSPARILFRPTDLTVTQLMFCITVAFLITNKVWSPQYSLWVLPLAALAIPTWWLVYAWASVEALLWPILMWHLLGTDNKGLPAWPYTILALVRIGLLIYMVVRVWRWNTGLGAASQGTVPASTVGTVPLTSTTQEAPVQ